MVSVVHQPEARLDEPFARQGQRSRLYGIRQRDNLQGVMCDGRQHAESGSAAEGGADEIWVKADHRSAPSVRQGSE